MMSCDFHQHQPQHQHQRVFQSLSEAYLSILEDVYFNPDYIHETVNEKSVDLESNPVLKNKNWYFNKCDNQEKVNYSFVIHHPSDTEDIVTRDTKRNSIIYEYSSKETVLFDNGDRVNIKDLSKVWQRIANPDGTINANYGYMVYHLKDAGNQEFDPKFLSQWEWAKNRLLLLKKTNQAYLHFNRPKDQWNENLDQPCCMNIQFQIRDDLLHLYVNMRSNDLVYGVPYNMLYFVKLMHRMVAELKHKYPNLKVGHYYYHTVSLHFYLKHMDKVVSMLGINNVGGDGVNDDLIPKIDNTVYEPDLLTYEPKDTEVPTDEYVYVNVVISDSVKRIASTNLIRPRTSSDLVKFEQFLVNWFATMSMMMKFQFNQTAPPSPTTPPPTSAPQTNFWLTFTLFTKDVKAKYERREDLSLLDCGVLWAGLSIEWDEKQKGYVVQGHFIDSVKDEIPFFESRLLTDHNNNNQPVELIYA